MPRATVFLTTLICVLTSDGSAQAVPNPGDRIRIKQVDGTVLTGTLTTFSLAAIRMSLGSDDRVADVPVARIEVLETSLGRQPNYPKYIGITVAASSLLGAIIGASVDTCSGVSGICVGPETRAEGVLVGLAGGAIIGLPLGAILGLLITEEQWDPVALPARAASRLMIRPVVGNRVGFAASVRVGGR